MTEGGARKPMSAAAVSITGRDESSNMSGSQRGDQLAIRRSALLSARLRFSPETQPLRDTAIDNIVQQNLLLEESEGGLTVLEIERQGVVSFSGDRPVIMRGDLKGSLERLVSQGRVARSGEGRGARYKLTQSAEQELWASQQEAENRLRDTVRRGLKYEPTEIGSYEAAFLYCVSLLFSSLSETYVRHLKGEVRATDLACETTVGAAIARTKSNYPEIDPSVLESAVIAFLSEKHPQSDAIKWNLAQSYFLANAIGLVYCFIKLYSAQTRSPAARTSSSGERRGRR